LESVAWDLLKEQFLTVYNKQLVPHDLEQFYDS
jgi:hypothetical protein